MWWGRKDDDAGSDSSSKKKRTTSTPSKKTRGANGRQKGGSATNSASLVSRRRPLLVGKKNKGMRHDGGGGDVDEHHTEQEETGVDPLPSAEASVEADLPGGETEQATPVVATPDATRKGPKPPTSPRKTLLSFQLDLAAREKVNRGQFNVRQWPALAPKKKGTDKITSTPIVGAPPNAKTGRHRVKLATGEHVAESDISFQDALFLLKSHQVMDEATCIETEIKLLDSELDALREDRAHLEAMSLQIPEDPQNKAADWEKHRLLAGRRITQTQRKMLQAKRGTCLTIGMKNTTTAKALAETLGAKKAVLSDYTADDRPNKVLQLSNQNCRDGGAATSLQHICISQEETLDPSFFLCHDHGKGTWLGRLPSRLFRRMKDNGMDPNEAAANLIFLASGPMDYYFAEFRSGEVWWGSPPSDEAFQTLCSEWDVSRVAFGPVTSLLDGTRADPKEHFSTSWIVLSRDGRIAWKNIPTRLHFLLTSRLADEAALEEVALGSGGSYFVRFLDGTVDYCLPSHIGVVCQQLEQDGATLTGMSLHPNLPHDFVIRSARITPQEY